MPSRQAMDSSDRASEATDSGSKSRAYHTFKYPEDLNYLDWLNNWASQAETVNGSGNQIGKTPPRRGLYQRWLCSNFPLRDPLAWYLSSRDRRLTAAHSLID